MTTVTRPGSLAGFGQNLPLVLLMGQSLSLGITLSLLIITGSALFLPVFGSGGLPYVYITVAILGAGLFYGFAELQKKWTLPRLTITTLAVIAAFLFVCWLGVSQTDIRWFSFAMMVSFSLIIQMGFVILGGQAGRLFDVRQLKNLFPRIVAGFVVGFLVGGLVGPPLARLLGATENLLLAATASTLCFLAFAVATSARFRPELTQTARATVSQRPASTPSVSRLLAKRFVLLIVLYQMLAAVVRQLLEFILFDQAAARFPDSASLTQFFGNFAVAVNVTDLLFIALFASLLLSRFGLNFGLLANPVVDGLLLLGQVVVGAFLGPTTALFFGLVVVVRITDITLTDGTLRGSTNAAYQALPANERVTVQTGVEGIGVPLALGLTGVILLIISSIRGLSIVHVSAFTLAITMLWMVLAILVFRDYAKALIQTMRRRALSEVEFDLDNSSSVAALEKLCDSDRLADIRLALDILEVTEHPSLNERLVLLVDHADPAVRVEALVRIERLKVEAATKLVDQRLTVETSPMVKGAALRAKCALGEIGVVEAVAPYLNDSAPEVRMGATVGLLRYGGIPGVLTAGQQLAALETSADPDDRCFVAQVIGQVGAQNFYQPLLSLLQDDDPKVRYEALMASALVKHPSLLPQVIDNLHQSGTRSAAMAALTACGPAALPYAEPALSAAGPAFDEEQAGRMARVCGQIQGEESIALLKQFMDHPHLEVRSQVLEALSRCGYRAEANDRLLVNGRLAAEAETAARILVASEDIGAEPAVLPLRRALDDELDEVRRRTLLLVSFLHDSQAILRAADQLASREGSQQALALEMLDVTLTAEEKSTLLTLVDPNLERAQKAQRLAKMVDVQHQTRDERIAEIAAAEFDVWSRGWLRVCALYAAGELGLTSLAEGAEAALEAGAYPVRETAAWALHRLAPERFASLVSQLVEDPDPRLARLATQLAA